MSNVQSFVLDSLTNNGGKKITYLQRNIPRANTHLTVNIYECDEHMLDLHISSRTAYFLAFRTCSAKELTALVDELFGMICHIRAKVKDCAFLLVHIKESGDKTDVPLYKVQNSLEEKITSWKTESTKEFDELFTSLQYDINLFPEIMENQL